MTTKKSSTDALGEILEKLGAMEAKIDDMEDRIEESSKPPPLTTDFGLVNPDPYGDKTVRIDNKYPNAPSLLKRGDIVRLKEETEKGTLILQNVDSQTKDLMTERGILGTVVGYIGSVSRT